MRVRILVLAIGGLSAACGAQPPATHPVESVDAGSASIAAEPMEEPAPEPDSGQPHLTIECTMRAATMLHIRDPDGRYHHWGAKPFKSIRFDKGSAEIPDGNDERLLFLAEAASWHPPAEITIEGHRRSGERGKIDRRRAEAVRDRLIELGVNPDWITVETHGDTRPIANPKSKQGQEANGRADVWVRPSWPPVPDEFIRAACPPSPDAGISPERP